MDTVTTVVLVLCVALAVTLVGIVIFYFAVVRPRRRKSAKKTVEPGQAASDAPLPTSPTSPTPKNPSAVTFVPGGLQSSGGTASKWQSPASKFAPPPGQLGRRLRPKTVPTAGHTSPVMPADDDPTMPVEDDAMTLKMTLFNKTHAAPKTKSSLLNAS